MRGFVKRHDIGQVLSILKMRLTKKKIIISFDRSLGFVLAEDVISDIDVPAFRRSTMDGYAVRAKDTFGASMTNILELRIIGEQHIGEKKKFQLNENECVRIMTGAMLPDDADAVVMAEYVEEYNGIAKISSSVTPGKNVSQIGEDIKKVEKLFLEGHSIRPQDAGVLASIRKSKIKVYKKPTIALIVTGDEVVDVSDEQKIGKIIDSNSYLLRSLAEKHGFKLNKKGIIKDRERDIKKAIFASSEDIIITTGATSVGEMDIVPKIVEELGELVIHGITMRPGAPMGLGFINDKPVFLLPGNPAAAMICFDRFVYSSLLVMQGLAPRLPYHKVSGRLSRKISSALGRTDFVRVKYADGYIDPIRVSGSSILTTMTRSDGFVIVDKNKEGVEEGARVEVYLYG
jgi:molybdopterin molybdotransferase